MRLFVALEIPASVRAALAEISSRLRPHSAPGVRWSDPRGIHLTLKFIGEVDAARLETIGSALAAVRVPDSVKAAFRGLGWFPNGRHPKVFWAGVDASAGMVSLASEMERMLEPLGIAREKRKFHPHLTLARIKSDESLDSLRREAEHLQATEFGRATYSEFDLMESKLRPQCAEHTRLARFAFSSPAVAGTSGAAT